MLKPDWLIIPADILSIILEYAGDPITYLSVQQTCRTWYQKLKMGTQPSQVQWQARLKQDFPRFNIPEETGQNYLLLYKELFKVRKQNMVSALNSYNQKFLPNYFTLLNKIRWGRYSLEMIDLIPPIPGRAVSTPIEHRLCSVSSSF